jgi:hypothetical protein
LNICHLEWLTKTTTQMTSSTAIIYLIPIFRCLPLYEGLQPCLGSQMVTDINVVSWASDATRSSPHSKGSHAFVQLYIFYAAIKNSVNHYRSYIVSICLKTIIPRQKDAQPHRNVQSSHQPNLLCYLIPFVRFNHTVSVPQSKTHRLQTSSSSKKIGLANTRTKR